MSAITPAVIHTHIPAAQVAAAMSIAARGERPSQQPDDIGQAVRAHRCAGREVGQTYTADGVVVGRETRSLGGAGDPAPHVVLMDAYGELHTCPASWCALRNLSDSAGSWAWLRDEAAERPQGAPGY